MRCALSKSAGRSLLHHAAFGARYGVSPPSSRRRCPSVAMTRSISAAARPSSHDRWGETAWPSSSTSTRPPICPVMPIAAIRDGSTCRATTRSTSHADSTRDSAGCSTQPGSGCSSVTGTAPSAIGFPSGANATALVVDVPASSPMSRSCLFTSLFSNFEARSGVICTRRPAPLLTRTSSSWGVRHGRLGRPRVDVQ